MTTTYPPGPRQYLPWQNLMAFQRDATGFLSNLAQTYGDIVHFQIGPRHFYLLNHPDYIKDVLVTRSDHFVKGEFARKTKRLLGEGLFTSEGAIHLQQRRLIQPIFHRKRIADYGMIMVDYTDHLSRQWQDGQIVDMTHEMMGLTLAIVGKTLFNTEIIDEMNKVHQAIRLFLADFWLMWLPMIDYLEKLPLPVPIFHRTKQASEQLDAIIYRLITEHRTSGDRGDLLSMLLEAQYIDEGEQSMNDKQVRDEVLAMFLAGHATTTNALVWTWYLLAQHPVILAKLQDELDTVLTGRLPTIEDLPQLTYTRMVLSEALRLYPPAWGTLREVTKKYEIGGYVCQPKSTIILSQWVTQRDARYYSNPQQFDPTHWTSEAIATRPKFAYFPFGAGPRLCIGEQFAWMEGILIIATLAQKWRMEIVPDQTIVVEPRVTLRPKYGLKLKLAQRGKSESE